MVGAYNPPTFYLHDELTAEGVEPISINENIKAINMEQVQALKPDLILLRDSFDRNTYVALSKIAPVAALRLQDTEVTLLALGRILQREKQAEDRLAEYESLLAQKRSNLKKLQDAYRKTAEENQRQAGRAENLVLQKTELEERFEQEQEMFRQEIRKQRFADQEEYREAKKWIEGWRQMNDQVKTYESLVVQKKSSVETLKGQLNGKRRQETESDVRKKNETDML